MSVSSSFLSVLARIPADHWGVDLIALAAAVGACALVMLGIVTPDQLPTLLDTVYWGLGILGVRAAALGAKRKAAAAQAAQLALGAAEAAKAHAVPDALRDAVAAANVLRLPSSPEE